MTRIVDRSFGRQQNARGIEGLERSPAERTHSRPARQPGMTPARQGKAKTKR